jgi:hypothetical protein
MRSRIDGFFRFELFVVFFFFSAKIVRWLNAVMLVDRQLAISNVHYQSDQMMKERFFFFFLSFFLTAKNSVFV